MGTLKVSIDQDGLVLTNPVAGTFRVYVQDDGSLLEEDSLGHWVAVSDSDGAMVGLVDVQAAVEAAVAVVLTGDTRKAAEYLSRFEAYPNTGAEIADAVIAFLAGDTEQSTTTLRELATRTGGRFIQGRLGSVGSSLLEGGFTDRGLAILELNTRLFPDSSPAWQMLGEAHMKHGTQDKALVFLKKAIEVDADNAAAKELIEQINAQRESASDTKEPR
jgi:tetratricopeptide (TPR) repeat protein